MCISRFSPVRVLIAIPTAALECPRVKVHRAQQTKRRLRDLSLSCEMHTIRPSHDEDIRMVTEIYTYYVLNTTSTLEITPPISEDMASRRMDVLSKHLPYLVLEQDSMVVGYGYGNWFKPRAAYRFTAEHCRSIWRKRRVGKASAVSDSML